MKRKFRLAKSADFKKVRDSGDTYYHPIVKMAILQNELPYSRFAVITSKIIGNAVERNRCKRKLRAVLNLLKDQYESGWDVIFIIKKSFLQSNVCEIQAVIEDLFLQAGLLKDKEKIYDR